MDINKWPVGGSRLETIGNIVYGMYCLIHCMPYLIVQGFCAPAFLAYFQFKLIVFRMGSVNLVVVVESTRVLIDQSDKDTNDFHLPSIIAVGAALGSLNVSPV